MPIDMRNYPENWKEISLSIRHDRAGGQCECMGECGINHSGRCEEMDHQPAQQFRGRVILTVAHLDHDTHNNDPANLRAMCQRCHLRYDLAHHRHNAAQTRRRRMIERGQLELMTDGVLQI